MSEKEKTILENLSKSLSKASDTQKEYLLGLADGMALMSESKRKSKRKPKQSKQVHMGAVVKVHRPTLTAEERAYRMEQIKKATIKLYMEAQKNEGKNQNNH